MKAVRTFCILTFGITIFAACRKGSTSSNSGTVLKTAISLQYNNTGALISADTFYYSYTTDTVLAQVIRHLAAQSRVPFIDTVAYSYAPGKVVAMSRRTNFGPTVYLTQTETTYYLDPTGVQSDSVVTVYLTNGVVDTNVADVSLNTYDVNGYLIHQVYLFREFGITTTNSTWDYAVVGGNTTQAAVSAPGNPETETYTFSSRKNMTPRYFDENENPPYVGKPNTQLIQTFAISVAPYPATTYNYSYTFNNQGMVNEMTLTQTNGAVSGRIWFTYE